jgi:hypothetical protein
MGSIFRHASSVLAWLGTSPSTIAVCTAVRSNPSNYLSWEEYEAAEPSASPALWRAEVERDVKEKGLVLASPEYWKRADERYAYIHDLFAKTSIDTDLMIAFEKLEYWTRAWITQELMLAARVVFVAGEEELNYALVEHRTRGLIGRIRWRGAGLMARDRFYSLLGVCPEVILVDYQIPDVEVLLGQ